MTMRILFVCIIAAMMAGGVGGQEIDGWLANISSHGEAQAVRLAAGAWGLPVEATTWWQDEAGAIAGLIEATPDGVWLQATLGPLSVAPVRLSPAVAPEEPARQVVDAIEAPAPLPFLPFIRDGEAFTAPWAAATIMVSDINRNGMPDMVNDLWLVRHEDRDIFGYQFLTAEQDPRQEGRALHVSMDLDKNGTIDGAEWQRPVWRFVDRTGNGTFFEGTLLSGGLLQQVRCAVRRRGSPDGRLWDATYTAYDLDGDGVADATFAESRSLQGEDWLTAWFDFTASGKSARIDIDVARGTINFIRPGEPFWSGHFVPGRDGVWRMTGAEIAQGRNRTYVFLTDRPMSRVERHVEPAHERSWYFNEVTYRRVRYGDAPALLAPWLPLEWRGEPIEPPTFWEDTRQISAWWQRVDGKRQREIIEPPRDAPELYHSSLFNGLHHAGASQGQLGDLHYYDRDGDGYIDQYLFRDSVDKRLRLRSLQYDRKGTSFVFRQDDQAVAWNSQTAVDFRVAEAGVATPTGAPLVTQLQLNPAGRLPGYPARPLTLPRIPFLVDGWHADQNPADYGFVSVVHSLDRLGYHPIDQVTPLVETTLPKNGVLLMSLFKRGPSDDEIRQLRDWIGLGGTLILAPARIDEGQRLTLNTVLEKLQLTVRFAPEPVTLPAGPGDYPMPQHAVTAFNDTTGVLLRGCRFIAPEGWSLSDTKRPLLLHGDRPLIGYSAKAGGHIYVIGFPLFNHAFTKRAEPSLNEGFRGAFDHDRLLDNFLKLLKEEISP